MEDTEIVKKLYYYLEEDFNKDLVKLNSYKEIEQRRSEKEKLLENCLSQTDYKLFDEYITCESEIESFVMQQAFIKGFKLANKLIIESLI